MFAILKIIERLTPEGKKLFEEAILFLPQTRANTGQNEIHRNEKDVIAMLPLGANICASSLKLAIINHYAKQGYVFGGDIDSGSFIEGRREIDFYLQVPDDDEYQSQS